MDDIGKLFGEKYLEKFRVFHESTLFPPDFSLLKKQRCPICGNKLKFPLRGKIVYCNGKKHAKKFVIRLDKYLNFISK